MLASSGGFAEIEWVDNHIPSFLENSLGSKQEVSNHVADTLDDDIDDFFYEELLENRFAEVDFDLDDLPSKPKEEKVQNPKEEVIFISRGFSHKEPTTQKINEIALVEPKDEEIELVQIADVGPFSPFSMHGKSVKLPNKDQVEEKIVKANEMIFFSSEDSSRHGFYLSSKKVTNRDYDAFVQATHHRPPPHWKGGTIPEGLENEPVVNVTYKDAFLYSIWAGKRLPKESELIIAAKTDGKDCDICSGKGEWTSTPSYGKQGTVRGASHLTMNSELSRTTYHKVFMGVLKGDSTVMDSNTYSNTISFRVAANQ